MTTVELLFISLVFVYVTVFESHAKVIYNESHENGTFELNIIHFNDFHARYEETNLMGFGCENKSQCIGGYSRLYSQIKSMKAANPDSIVLNAGDVAFGTFWYTIGSWNVSQEFMNKLQIDVEVLGNHEFDFSIEGVVDYIKALKHPVVVSNIDDSQEPTLQGLYTKSHVVQRGDKKIGIIGVDASNFDKLANAGNLKFLPESSSVNAEAERLVREEGVFTNIVLSHAGYPVDQEIAVNASEKISLIVGGHSHSLLLSEGSLPIPDKVKGPYPTVIKSKLGHNIAVVQAAAYSRLLGNITIFLNENGELENFSGRPISLDQNIPQDSEINEELTKWKTYIESAGNRVVGSTTIDLSHSDCYYKECTLGNAVADAMLDLYTNKLGNQKTPNYDKIAVINIGGLRHTIHKGNINFKDITMAIPFRNTVDIGEIQGKELKDLFESTTLPSKVATMRLLQVAGAKIIYNLTQPIGHRIASILILSQNNSSEELYEDLDFNRTYHVILPNFLSLGGDGFDLVPKNLRNRKVGPIDVTVFKEYLENNSPISGTLQERLIFDGDSFKFFRHSWHR